MKTNLQNYLKDVQTSLNPNVVIPRTSWIEIDHNLEMIPADHEDAIVLYQAGIITNLELVDIFLGKRVLKIKVS